MKPAFFYMVFLISTGIMAQTKEGVVIYERKQNMHRSANEEMRAMIPEFNISKQMLLFTEQQSLYKALPEDEAPDPFNNKSGAVIMLGGRSSETYVHFGENRKVKATEIFGEAFLITDTINKHNWKLVDETKTIAGHLCKKAVTTTKSVRQTVRISAAGKEPDKVNTPTPKPEDIEVVAWYAVDLHSSAGPENYMGLPGVVLEVDVDNNGIVFSAQEVRPLSDLSQLKAPKKGRKVTPEEYNKEMKKIVENMGSGPIQIRSGM